jgi:transposase
MARPTKFSNEIKHKIITAIRAGNYIETASAYAGISKNTLYDWLRRGEREKQRVEKNPRYKIRKSEQPFVDFSDAVEKALAEAEVRDVAIIAKAAEEQWQAAAWRLERKFPDRWGRKVIEHKGSLEVKNDDSIKRIEQQLKQDDESRELLKEFFRRSKEISDNGEGISED